MQSAEREVGAGDDASTQDIEVLQSHGINAADIKKLRAAGIGTLKGIQQTTRKRMAAIKGLSEAKVEKVKEAVTKLIGGPFKTALQVSEHRKLQFRVSTGSTALDNVLGGGGIESQNLTEVHGEYRCGKTQLSHTLSVTCQVPAPGYRPGKALFMDTENTFRPDRLRDIARRFQLDEDAVLENVTVARIHTTDDQIEFLDHVAGKFNEERGQYRLLIIDSVMALFRVDYCGRGELSERQQKLGQFLSRVSKIAEEYNVAVFMTNQMTADPGATMSFQADPKKPIGGNILGHAATVRISLRKGRGSDRIAKVVDAPDLPEAEATFALAEGGVVDSENQ